MATCVICSTPFIHHGYYPVSPGCECTDRICQNCCRMGELERCPLCRKTAPMTAVDRALLKTARANTAPGAAVCLGCSKPFPSKKLASHERSCSVYRDWFDRMLCAEIALRSNEITKASETNQDFTDRMEFQEERIEELEEIVEDLVAQCALHKRRADDLREGLVNLLKRNRPPTPAPVSIHRRYFDHSSDDDNTPTTTDAEDHLQPPPASRRRMGPGAAAAAAGAAGAGGPREAPAVTPARTASS